MVARVVTLFAAGERVAIRADRLRAGVGVVVEGNERVFPGQPLMVLGAEAGSAPAAGHGGGGRPPPSGDDEER